MTPHTPKQPRTRSYVVLRVTLREIAPPIWRRLQVPDHYTLHQLHRVLQVVFGWLDYHLYSFEIGSRRFEAPDVEAEDEDSTAVTIANLQLASGAEFKYTYDFGDNWIHHLRVEAVRPVDPEEEEPLPVLLDGERAGPHEDSGGPYSHEERLGVLRDPKHPEHDELRTWFGKHYDPEKFDVWHTNQNLTLAAAWGAI